MCTHHSTDRNPLNCILPPHMVDQIVANGSAEQRARAEETQVQSALMRKSRDAFSGEFRLRPPGWR